MQLSLYLKCTVDVNATESVSKKIAYSDVGEVNAWSNQQGMWLSVVSKTSHTKGSQSHHNIHPTVN